MAGSNEMEDILDELYRDLVRNPEDAGLREIYADALADAEYDELSQHQRNIARSISISGSNSRQAIQMSLVREIRRLVPKLVDAVERNDLEGFDRELQETLSKWGEDSSSEELNSILTELRDVFRQGRMMYDNAPTHNDVGKITSRVEGLLHDELLGYDSISGWRPSRLAQRVDFSRKLRRPSQPLEPSPETLEPNIGPDEKSLRMKYKSLRRYYW